MMWDLLSIFPLTVEKYLPLWGFNNSFNSKSESIQWFEKVGITNEGCNAQQTDSCCMVDVKFAYPLLLNIMNLQAKYEIIFLKETKKSLTNVSR